MSWLPYALAGWLFLAGLYGIVTGRNLIGIAVCVSVCQSATYVLLLAIGYRNRGTAPVFAEIPTKRRPVVDPVVQSLTLTDIVISVAVASLLLTLAVNAHRKRGTLDPTELVEMKG